MKQGTETKLKFKLLMRRLNLSLWQARGLLDTLWAFTANNYPDGELTTVSHEELAIAIDWRDEDGRGDAAALVRVLIELRWLDEVPVNPHSEVGDNQTHGGRTAGVCKRLFVHDWREHCEDTVHKVLARSGRRFAQCGSVPSFSRLSQSEREKYAPLFERMASPNGVPAAQTHGGRTADVRRASEKRPSLAKPSLTIPTTPPTPSSPKTPDSDHSPEPGGEGVFVDSPEPEDPTPESIATAWRRVREAIEAKPIGFKHARWAVDFGAQRGLSPDEVLAAAKHATTTAGLTISALDWFLRNHEPGRAVDDERSWPSLKASPSEPIPKRRLTREEQITRHGFEAMRIAKDEKDLPRAVRFLVENEVPKGDWPAYICDRLGEVEPCATKGNPE